MYAVSQNLIDAESMPWVELDSKEVGREAEAETETETETDRDRQTDRELQRNRDQDISLQEEMVERQENDPATVREECERVKPRKMTRLPKICLGLKIAVRLSIYARCLAEERCCVGGGRSGLDGICTECNLFKITGSKEGRGAAGMEGANKNKSGVDEVAENISDIALHTQEDRETLHPGPDDVEECGKISAVELLEKLEYFFSDPEFTDALRTFFEENQDKFQFVDVGMEQPIS
eukprot:746910-Hanusia_phi.AAC.1